MASGVQAQQQQLSSACRRLQAQMQAPGADPQASVAMLREVVHLQEALQRELAHRHRQAAQAALGGAAAADRSCGPLGAAGRTAEDLEDLDALLARREALMAMALAPLSSVAISLRAVVDSVAELVPQPVAADGSTAAAHVPSVEDVLALGHRIRYTTFASTGLFSGEPAPQQAHFDASSMWEHDTQAKAAAALRQQHELQQQLQHQPSLQRDQEQAGVARSGANDEGGGAGPPAEADAIADTFLDHLLLGGWAPSQAIPDEMLQQLISVVPGARQALQRRMQARFGVQGPAQPPAPTLLPAGQALPQSQAKLVASSLHLDDDEDDDDDDDSDDDDDDEDSDDDDDDGEG